MVPVVPRPIRLKEGEGTFCLSASTRVYAEPEALMEATLLADRLEQLLGWRPEVAGLKAQSLPTEAVVLDLRAETADLGDEAYFLAVTRRGISISARKPAGLFYGCQTLAQLAWRGAVQRPAATEHGRSSARELGAKPSRSNASKALVPCVEIRDSPRFRWRGLMLDVCRHFYPAEFVKRFIDVAALHKMNVFHWHLTEDQGWRIEVPGRPRLAEVAAWRKQTLDGHLLRLPHHYDGVPHGGYYTQGEVREIVAYAAARHVTVVPEIEMPGHCQAALAAYPELSCRGGPFEVSCRWGIHKDVYCAGNEAVFEFIEGVLDEVIPLFPSPFFHIGGDECPKGRWRACPKCRARMKAEALSGPEELQSWFIRRIERFLGSRGKRLVGWDEILEGGLAPNATVMSWRGVSGGIRAARQGHEVVMTPSSHCYLDAYQSRRRKGEPLAIGGCATLAKVYSYEPVSRALTGEQAGRVLGLQGNLWTEYIPTPEKAEYMCWPRACALAEIGWSATAGRSWEDFHRRLAAHQGLLDRLGVNYRKLDEP